MIIDHDAVVQGLRIYADDLLPIRLFKPHNAEIKDFSLCRAHILERRARLAAERTASTSPESDNTNAEDEEI